MTVTTPTYRAGQTYTLTLRPTTGQLVDSEVGAIFEWPSGGLTLRRIVVLSSGTNTLIPATTLGTNALLTRAPTRVQIDAADVGAVYVFPQAENPNNLDYAYIDQVNNRKYARPWDSVAEAPTLYLSGNTYQVRAWPHKTLVEGNVILDWGDTKQISSIVGGVLSYQRYEEAITGWVPGSIWTPPSEIRDPILINWPGFATWDSSNIEKIPDWGASELIYRNFGGIAEFDLQVGFSGSDRFLIDGTVNPIFVGKEPTVIDNGFRFTIPSGTGFEYFFRFITLPVKVDAISILISSPARNAAIYSSGPIKWESLRNPRLPRPEFESQPLFGLFKHEVYEDTIGWNAGTLANPFPADPFSIDGVCDGFKISVDNTDFPGDTTVELTLWTVRPVDQARYYRVTYDNVGNRFLGQPLGGGSSVVLTTQNTRGNWIQSQPYAYDMDFPPAPESGQLQGFFEEQAQWMTDNEVLYRLREDEPNGADWFIQKSGAIAHPFEGVTLQTYPNAGAFPNALGVGISINQVLERPYQGLFLYLDQTESTRFIENETSLSVLNNGRGDLGDPIPTIDLSLSDGKSDIRIFGGDTDRFQRYASLFRLEARADRANMPGRLDRPTENTVYIARDDVQNTFLYQVASPTRVLAPTSAINGFTPRDNDNQYTAALQSLWDEVFVVPADQDEVLAAFAIAETLRRLGTNISSEFGDGGDITLQASNAYGIARGGRIFLKGGTTTSGFTGTPPDNGSIYLWSPMPDRLARHGMATFAAERGILSDGTTMAVDAVSWKIAPKESRSTLDGFSGRAFESSLAVRQVPFIRTKTISQPDTNTSLTKYTIEFGDPNENYSLNEVLDVEAKISLSDLDSATVEAAFNSRPEIQELLAGVFENKESETRYLVKLEGRTQNQWILAHYMIRLTPGSREFGITNIASYVREPIAVWNKEEYKGYFLIYDQTRLNNLYPIGAAEEQIIHSAIAPLPSTEEPTWEKWHQETDRAISQFVWWKIGNLYKPVPVPWCCYPEKEYDLLKPLTIDRDTTAPTTVDEQPDWQIRTVEDDTTLQWFTWVNSGGQFVPVQLSWQTDLIDGVLTPEPVLTKPESGGFGDLTNTNTALIVRSEDPPVVSTERPTWELYIQETSTTLKWYAHAKSGAQYRPIPLPWVLVRDAATGLFSQEYEIVKPTPSGTPGQLSSEIRSIIERDSAAPLRSSFIPNWQLWIEETATQLSLYTWGHLGDEYRPIRIPFTVSFDVATRTLTPEYSLREP